MTATRLRGTVATRYARRLPGAHTAGIHVQRARVLAVAKQQGRVCFQQEDRVVENNHSPRKIAVRRFS